MNYSWKIPDPTLWGFWGHYIRGFWLGWLLYPLLMIFDIDLVVRAISKLKYGKNPNNSDDINFIVSLIYAQRRMPTPLGWLAKIIYRHRPLTHAGGTSGAQSALDYYFSFDGPKFNEVYRSLVEKL